MGMSFALSSFRIPQKPCPQAAFKSSREVAEVGKEMKHTKARSAL